MTDPSGEIHLRNLLQSVAVGELTREARLRLVPSDSIALAIEVIGKGSHGCALVCEEGSLVGIVTERDILHTLDTDIDLAGPLSTIMTRDPTTVATDASLFRAISLMDSGGYRRLPVLDVDGHPTGIVDVKTVTGFLVEHYPEAVYNCASLAQVTTSHREGA